MTRCCDPRGCDAFFTDRVARRDADRYRRQGLDRNAQRVVDFVVGEGIADRSVLEVGGGVGAIQLELLRAGAAGTTNAELSPAYEAHAAELAHEAGLVGRSDRHVVDFAEEGDAIGEADVVVLHKVVCCYPDHERLVGEAALRARHQLVLTFPRDVLWLRVAFAAMNLSQRIRRRAFRVYLHRPPAIVAVAQSHGLEPVSHHRGLMWEFRGLARVGAQP